MTLRRRRSNRPFNSLAVAVQAGNDRGPTLVAPGHGRLMGSSREKVSGYSSLQLGCLLVISGAAPLSGHLRRRTHFSG